MSSGGIARIYKKLYASFGPQRWWPAESAFEVMVGAILTQNTSWQNVEKAIANLKKSNLLTARKLYALAPDKLALLLKPAGYYNIKAKRLRNFLKFFIERFSASPKKMARVPARRLRRELLSVNGVGPETADSILLYALNKPVFVVDAYTKRIFSRHRFIKEGAQYGQVQDFFQRCLQKSPRLFNEYHALIVKLGKDFCRKSKPRCAACPLR
jgi:endonuclease-3 related protein